MATKIDPKWEALVESIKEPIRLIILAIITWLIYFIVPQLDPKYAPLIVLVLRFADKYVHEYRSTAGTEGVYKGLVGI